MSDKKSTIAELDQLTEFYKQKQSIEDQLRKFKEDQPDYVATLKNKLRTYQTDQFDKLKVPELPTIYKNTYTTYEGARLPFWQAIFVLIWEISAVILLLGFVFDVELFSTGVYILLILLFLGGIYFVNDFCEYDNLSKYGEWEQKDKKWRVSIASADYNSERRAFFEQCVAFDAQFPKLVDECEKKKHELVPEYVLVESKRKENFNQTKEVLEAKIAAIDAQINSIDLLHRDFHYLSNEISRMLKTGRAESVKEGLNLVIEEHERKEAMRRMEAAAELERRERRDAELRAQQQAAAEQARKDAAYREAERKYKSAAARYSDWSARGNTRNALNAKSEMERALAEMHRNS